MMLEDKLIDNLEATSIFYMRSMEATDDSAGVDINNLKPLSHWKLISLLC